jgi:hypothetical protein
LNDFFRLESFGENEFKVSVHGNLDREVHYEHVITVSCSDGGTPSRSANDLLPPLSIAKTENE